MYRKKILTIIIIFLLLISCFVLFKSLTKNNLTEISMKKYYELIDNKESFIIEVMKDDCSHCIAFRPKLIEVTNKYNIDVYYINVGKLNSADYKKFMKDANVDGTPTLIFYEDGYEETEAARIVGNASTTKLIEKFKENNIIK